MKKTNVMRLLDAEEISYKPIEYDKKDGFIDGQSVAKKIGYPVENVFKTLVVKSKEDNLYVALLPVGEELDLKKLSNLLGEKNIHMLPAKDLLKTTGYVHGGCSPLGMKKDLPTIIDSSVENLDYLIFSGGKIGSQVKISIDELKKILAYNIGDIIK